MKTERHERSRMPVERYVPPMPEPSRDPNPFHHAVALIEEMDLSNCYLLGKVLLARMEELGGRNGS